MVATTVAYISSCLKNGISYIFHQHSRYLRHAFILPSPVPKQQRAYFLHSDWWLDGYDVKYQAIWSLPRFVLMNLSWFISEILVWVTPKAPLNWNESTLGMLLWALPLPQLFLNNEDILSHWVLIFLRGHQNLNTFRTLMEEGHLFVSQLLSSKIIKHCLAH